ncbi:focadhesin-like [Antedon mediterranea]|uniref:focadhesin-like n=1 Tax=Antedon mediterranea TaxID=105859 RepID=UPI003AF7C511
MIDMSEDLKKRLVFNNRAVQNSAIKKIKCLIINGLARAEAEGVQESQLKKLPELELLWDQCQVEASYLSHACCSALTSLVLSSHLNMDDVFRGFLNVYPSACNVSGIVKALVNLLVLQIKTVVSKKTEYNNPYKIRSPPHPLITCLTSRPNTWPTIFHHIQNLFSSSDKSIQPYIIPMLEPLLKYVFLEPVQTAEYAGLRASLYSSLLQQCTLGFHGMDKVFQKTIVNFFLQCIPKIQICLSQCVAEITTFIGQFSTILLSSRHDNEECTLFSQLSNYVTALCLHVRQLGLDTSDLLVTLQKLVKGNSLPQSTIVLIGWLILEATSLKELSLLLEFVEEALSNSYITKPIALFLAFPLVQLISSPPLSISLHGDPFSTIQKRASYCLSLIQSYKSDDSNMNPSKVDIRLQNLSGISVCPSYADIKTFTNLILHLHGNDLIVHDWLAVIQSKVTSKSVSNHVILTIASILLKRQEELVDGCLQTLLVIGRMDPSKSPVILTLLLYLLGIEDRPPVTMLILNAIPQTATHRYNISPALKVIQSLGATQDMFPVSIRLLSALWKLQDRCFPHLQKMLTFDMQKSQSKSFEYNEELLAKTATMRDICITRPFQHGPDLLHLLSTILSDYTESHHAIPASFALEGVAALCEAEVVDIRSTWGLLSPKLQHDERMLVQVSLCKLLSLVPSLVVNTEEYEEFRCDVVELLWLLSSNQKAAVSGAAFKALSKFDQEEFTLYDLPEEVTLNVRQKLANLKKDRPVVDGDDEEENEDDKDEDIDVPGCCYMQLLLHVDQDILPDFGCFLTSMVQKEVKDLPRSIYHASDMKQSINEKSDNKAVSTISGILKNKYERNKQPGLKAGLAGGLLCCFDSIHSAGRDGKLERRHIASSGRGYQQMLTTLVNEVPIQSSEWFQSLHLPISWKNFVERSYFSILEGRKAELEIQQSHGHRDEEDDDLETAQSIAWLWTRDKLTDILKSCARGNPSAQANSILALASLACVSTKHANSLGSDAQKNQSDAPEHMGQNFWLETAAETVLCLVNNNYKAKKRVFSWCQRSSERRGQSSVSPVVKSCAALALCTLVPVLTTNHSELIFKMVDCLCAELPQKDLADTHISHVSLGLGFLLKTLYEERFIDVTDQEGKLMIMKALDRLEELCLVNDMENVGNYLGLMLALVGMCHDGSTQTRVHLSSVFGKLKSRLDSDENNLNQGLLMCISCVTASLFAANLASKDVVLDVVTKMLSLQSSHETSSMFSLSLGLLLHSLLRANYPQVVECYNKVCTDWFGRVDDKTIETPERLAAINGLSALLAGPGALVYGISESTLPADINAKTTKLVKQMILLMNDNSDMTLQSQSSWFLGYVYLVTLSMPSMASASTTYNQLPESSILRSAIDMLIEAGKLGSEGLLPARLEVLMKALWQGCETVLPPLNWAGVLSPIKRLAFGTSVHVLCLQLALRECVSSPNASLFLTAWTGSSLFNTLQAKEKELLYNSLPVLIKTMPLAKLKFFLATSILEPFTNFSPVTVTLCASVLEGLKAALAVPDPPQSVTYLLYQAVETIYFTLPRNIENYQCILLSDCVCQLPGEVIDRLTSPEAEKNLIRSTFIRSHTVGKQPLVWLNPCIDVAMNCSEAEQQVLLWYILSSLSRSASINNEQINDLSRLNWLLELMGHIHNVATCKQEGSKNDGNFSRPVQFLIKVFTAAVTAWSSPTNITNLSVPLEFNTEKDIVLDYGSVGCRSMEVFICQELVAQLPASLVNLLNLTPWNQIIDKIIDWLITLLKDASHMLSPTLKVTLKECVYSLRHTTPFKKFAVWSKALSNLD